MRIEAAFGEFRALESKETRRKQQPADVEESQDVEAAVESENRRAFTEALNNKEFEAKSLEELEKIKEEIDRDTYQADSREIALKLIYDETRGEINLGLFSS